MTTSEPTEITADEFQQLVRRAGLDLTPEEMEQLRPMYEELLGQVSKLHDPNLPLEVPAATFRAD